MVPLFHLVFSFFTRAHAATVDENYLAGSADLLDLERRQRMLDERGRDPLAGIALGLYAS